jgi:hypothetical protein
VGAGAGNVHGREARDPRVRVRAGAGKAWVQVVESTLRFMHDNADVFWRSDPRRVLQAVQADLRLPCEIPSNSPHDPNWTYLKA